ncbi:hypothetical protein S83_037615, partial [Arachis hypogaea]
FPKVTKNMLSTFEDDNHVPEIVEEVVVMPSTTISFLSTSLNMEVHLRFGNHILIIFIQSEIHPYNFSF